MTACRKQANPVFQGPVLFATAASRVYGDNRLAQRREKFAGKVPIFYRRKNSLGKIDNVDSQCLDCSRKLPRGVAGVFYDPCGSANQILNATSTKVGFEYPVWVVKITDDKIEAHEIIGQFSRKLRVAREKSGERPVFDRMHRLRIESIF